MQFSAFHQFPFYGNRHVSQFRNRTAEAPFSTRHDVATLQTLHVNIVIFIRVRDAAV